MTSSELLRDSPESTALKPPPQIVAVAVVQFAVSALVWAPSGLLLSDDAIMYHRYAAAAAAPHSIILLPIRSHEYYALVIGVPLCLSLLGAVTGRGLLRMRNWARRTTLYMATVPVCGGALFLRLYHAKSVPEGAIFVIGDFTPVIVGVLLVVLFPVSVWWWMLLTRKTVRSRFR
jgi:Sec-independent protein secretion pathway component TatC